MKSVANTAVMTPSMIGMPVRGAVVRRHQRSAAARVSWDAAASARASACRAFASSRASPSSASVRKPSTSSPTSRATSASPSSTASAAPRAPSPPGACRPSSDARRDVQRHLLDALLHLGRQRRAGGLAQAAAGADAQHGGLELHEALAPRRHRGHHGDAEVPREHLGVRRPPAARGLVREVQRHDDAVAHVEQLQRQVQAARQVGGVGDGDHDVRPPLEQRAAGGLLVVARPVQRVAAGQVDDLDGPALPARADGAGVDAHAGAVGRLARGPGERVEQRRLADVGVAGHADDQRRRRRTGGGRLAAAVAERGGHCGQPRTMILSVTSRPRAYCEPPTRTSSGPLNGATLSTSTGVSGSSPSEAR